MKMRDITGWLICLLIIAPVAGFASQTLLRVKERDYLRCGVNANLPGFSSVDNKGNWTGMDVDFCRGLAAVVLGDAEKVKFISLSDKERLVALQAGRIDVLARNQTWTRSRDTTMGLSFVGPLYFDELGILLKSDALSMQADMKSGFDESAGSDLVKDEKIDKRALLEKTKPPRKILKKAGGSKQNVKTQKGGKEKAAGLEEKKDFELDSAETSVEPAAKSKEAVDGQTLADIVKERAPGRFDVVANVNFCLISQSRAANALSAQFRRDEIKLRKTEFKDSAELISGLMSGECDGMVADKFDLYSFLQQIPERDEWLILDESLTIEPVGPVVKENDPKWLKIVRWSLLALVQAEFLGLNTGNIDAMLRRPDYDTKQFVKQNTFFQSSPLMPAGWSKRLILSVGNYGEIFDRNVGSQSPLKIERGMNRLWNDGGLMYSPSFR